MKYKITLFFLIFLPVVVSAQYKKTQTTIRDTFPDGKVKQITEIYIKESKKYELHNYEKHTRKVITRYYTNGKIHYRQVIENSQGPDQKPCAESFFKQEEFWDNGNKKSLMKFECDCHIYVYKEWNYEGKLLNKMRSKIKRFY